MCAVLSNSDRPFGVLFVCTGNICRSPTAEGVFRRLIASRGLQNRVICDSAGMIGLHDGDPPDPRTCAEALTRGLDLSELSARKVVTDDLHRFDLLIALDRSHLSGLRRMSEQVGIHPQIRLLLNFHPHAPSDDEVPDPYYGGPQGFADVFDLIEAACCGLLDSIADQLNLGSVFTPGKGIVSFAVDHKQE